MSPTLTLDLDEVVALTAAEQEETSGGDLVPWSSILINLVLNNADNIWKGIKEGWNYKE